MAATSNDRPIFLDDILGKEDFGAIEWRDGELHSSLAPYRESLLLTGWPSAGLRFKQGMNSQPPLDRLQAAAGESGSFSV